ALVFGQGAEVGVVADGDGQAHAQAAGEGVAEGLVDPADVGAVADDAVGLADHAAEGDAHADADGVGRGLADHLAGESGQDARDVVEVELVAGAFGLPAIQDLAAEADAGGDEAVDADVEGQDVDAGGFGPDDQGGSSG